MDNNQRSLSKDTNKALGEVALTIKNLGNLYKEETSALEKNDSNMFMALKDKKLEATYAYQNDMGQILARKNELKGASSAAKDKLKQVENEFSELSRKNLVAIERMQRCTERLGNTLRNAVLRDAQRASSYGYGANGAIANSVKRRAVSSGLSESV